LRLVNGYWLPEITDDSFHRLLMAAGQENEEAPIQRTIAGLFDELHVSLRRYVIFLGLTPEDADDGVQEAFLRLHKHLRSRGDQSNIRGWLFQVARNIARDKRRGAWRRRTASSRPEWASLFSFRDPADSPEDRLLKDERLAWLQSAMERLTPQQADCLRLRAAGLRYREIAAVMGIGISAAGELAQRAMARLNGKAS
jgi:RNA polymerase sigma-70 factor, ECF subfamily